MTVVLTTERMVLRHFTAHDADLLVELDGDPDVMRYLTGGVPTPRAEIENEVLPRLLGYYDRFPGFGIFAADDRDDGGFLGWFMFRPDAERPEHVELGYRLRKPCWGRGLATEGARALVRYGFTRHDVRQVYAETMAVNARSRRVMEKAGLRHVLTYHGSWPYPAEGAEHGEVRYVLDRTTWAAGGAPDVSPVDGPERSIEPGGDGREPVDES